MTASRPLAGAGSRWSSAAPGRSTQGGASGDQAHSYTINQSITNQSIIQSLSHSITHLYIFFRLFASESNCYILKTIVS